MQPLTSLVLLFLSPPGSPRLPLLSGTKHHREHASRVAAGASCGIFSRAIAFQEALAYRHKLYQLWQEDLLLIPDLIVSAEFVLLQGIDHCLNVVVT